MKSEVKSRVSVGYFSIYNMKIISGNNIIIIHDKNLSLSQRHIIRLSSRLFIGRYLIKISVAF